MAVYSIKLKNRIPDMSTLTLLSPNKGFFYQGMISKDGQHAVFWQHCDSGRIWHTKTDATERCEIQSLHQICGHPFFTHDEKHILFSAVNNAIGKLTAKGEKQNALKEATANIWIMNKDGHNQRQLTKGNYLDFRPCISPDGETIVFPSNRACKNLQLWKLDINKGELEPISQNPGYDFRPIFSYDGKMLAYQTHVEELGSEKLVLRNWETGEERVPIKIGPNESIHGAYFLKNSKEILFHARFKGGKYNSVYIYNIETSEINMIEIKGLCNTCHATLSLDEAIMVFDARKKHLFDFFLRILRNIITARVRL